MIDFTPHPEIAVPVPGKGFDPLVYGEQYKAVYRNDYEAIFRDIAKGELPAVQVYRQLCRSDLFFITFFVMENPLVNSPFGVGQCQMVEFGPDTDTLDVWARGHLKSWIITQGETIQYILKNPEMCHCIFSYSKTAADKFTSAIKDTLEKEMLVQWFPDVLFSRPDSESSSWSIQNGIRVRRNSVSRKEHTVNSYGLVEGMPTGGHWDRLVFDDTETEDMGRSAEQIQVLRKAHEMAKNFGVPSGTKTRDIGTYYTHEGLLTHLRDMKYVAGEKEGEPMYLYRKVPATHDGKRDGRPVFFSQEALDKIKGDSTFNSQQLCDPTPTTEIKLNSSLLKPIEPRFIPKGCYRFMVIDQAGDDKLNKGRGDQWAVGVFDVEPFMDQLGASNVYLVDAFGGRLSHSEAIDGISKLYLRNGMILQVGVEKVALSTTEIHISDALRVHGRRVSVDDKNLKLLLPSGRSVEKRVENALQWPLLNGKLHYSTSISQIYIDRIKEEMDKFPFFHPDFINMWAYLYDMLAEFEFYMPEEDDEEDRPNLRLVSGRSVIGGY